MPEPEKATTSTVEKMPEQPPREISLTDHLNKKLLTSLFKRLDEEAKADPPESTPEDDKEWE